MKRLFKKSQKVVKGTPSAVVLSILIHAGLFLLAGMLVVFTVVHKPEQIFEPPKAVKRPKMKLKKPKVNLKKSSKPKSTTRIVTKANRVSMPDIQLPEMSGMGDGLGDGFGDGFDMMPDLGEITIFGGGQTIGNDFVGTLFDLKRDRQGGLIAMDEVQFMLELRKYCKNGWLESDLSKYYRSPKNLYTTHFIVPPIITPMAPDAFGDPEMESYWFFVRYEGKLVFKEDIKFRFWGMGDAYIVVRVNGKHVLVDGWPGRLVQLDFWQSLNAESDKYFVGNRVMKVGDWIELKAGEPVDMQVIFGEWKGGEVAASLLVEVEGVDYPESRQGGPLLPAFKTEEFSLDMLDEIRKYLPEGEVDLTNGPVFNDYFSKAAQPVIAAAVPSVDETSSPDLVQSMPDEERSGPRVWTMADGESAIRLMPSWSTRRPLCAAWETGYANG